MKVLNMNPKRALIMLEGVRLSFPCFWEPQKYQGKGEARYGANFHIEKGSEQDNQIKAMLKDLVTKGWGVKGQTHLKNFWGDKQKICYLAGKREEEEGMMILSAYRYEVDGPPVIIDQSRNRLDQSAGRPYGGCYVNAKVEVYLQEGANMGIRGGLVGVQFVKDGPSFGGAAPATDDGFETLEGGDDSFDDVSDSTETSAADEDDDFLNDDGLADGADFLDD